MADPVNRISGVGPAQPAVDLPKLRTTGTSAGTRPFKEVLAETITEVARLQADADTAVKQLVAGEVKDVTDAMIAVEKADLSFQTMMAVRNKMVAAYEEIMRMSV